MKTMIMVTVAVLWLSSALAMGQPGKTYTDSRGKQVFFPLGDRSFADRVFSFAPGNPPASSKYNHPERALGTPNFGPGPLEVEHTNAVSLGCKGTLTLQFIDNALVDVAKLAKITWLIVSFGARGSDYPPEEFDMAGKGGDFAVSIIVQR